MVQQQSGGEIPRAMLDKFKDAVWGAEQLKRIFVFKRFSLDELKDIYLSGEIRTLRPQSHAVIEGEPSRGLYIILHGTVSVYKTDPVSGSMARLAHLDAGSYFGEISLFDSAPRSATVSADTYCYLFYLDATMFEQYLKTHGDNARSRFYQACAEDMAERFRNINSDYIASQQLLWKYALRRAEDGGSTTTPKK